MQKTMLKNIRFAEIDTRGKKKQRGAVKSEVQKQKLKDNIELEMKKAASKNGQGETEVCATRCNTLQHAATRCNMLQHAAICCTTLQDTATHCDTLQLTATRCNKLRNIATHCSML